MIKMISLSVAAMIALFLEERPSAQRGSFSFFPVTRGSKHTTLRLAKEQTYQSSKKAIPNPNPKYRKEDEAAINLSANLLYSYLKTY